MVKQLHRCLDLCNVLGALRSFVTIILEFILLLTVWKRPKKNIFLPFGHPKKPATGFYTHWLKSNLISYNWEWIDGKLSICLSLVFSAKCHFLIWRLICWLVSWSQSCVECIFCIFYTSKHYTTWIQKKDAPFHLLIKLTQKVLKNFSRGSDFEDFQIIFHSRPIPDLYLRRFRSWSFLKWDTILLNCIFFKGTAKTNLATFLLKLMPFPNEKR